MENLDKSIYRWERAVPPCGVGATTLEALASIPLELLMGSLADYSDLKAKTHHHQFPTLRAGFAFKVRRQW